jgi:hypothetical protein
MQNIKRKLSGGILRQCYWLDVVHVEWFVGWDSTVSPCLHQWPTGAHLSSPLGCLSIDTCWWGQFRLLIDFGARFFAWFFHHKNVPTYLPVSGH